ncbi:MAG: helix-turn-helix transcriptional regulator [Gordonibacter sp.]|nr:helix-turn-helix transcriptional regulator [Gordonibacter sp.]
MNKSGHTRPQGNRKAVGAETRPRFSGWKLLGLGFWQAWWMISMCTDTLLPTKDHFPFAGNTTLWVLVLTTIGYFVVVCASRVLSPFSARRSSYVLAGGLTALGTLTVPFSLFYGQGGSGFTLFLAGTAAIALGNALLLIMWGELWSTLAIGRVGRHLYVSYTFAFILFFVGYALPQPASSLFAAVLPIVSVVVLYACRSEPRRAPSVLPLDIRSIPFGRILVSILIISIVYGLSQGMANTFNSEDSAFIAKALVLAGGAIAAITLSMTIAPSDAEPITLYRPVVPAMVTGLILLLLLDAQLRFVGVGLIIMGVYCLDMFMMLVSTDVAFRSRLPIALTFGVVILAARIGTLIGSTAAHALQNVTFWSEALRSDVFLLGTLAVVLVGMLFFTETDVRKLYASPTIPRIDLSVEEKCARIVTACGLTQRESEVLVLLARGRTVRYLCDELSIAQGTAKHHVSNIYRKIGVFDRQGLLDTIEQGGVGRSTWE